MKFNSDSMHSIPTLVKTANVGNDLDHLMLLNAAYSAPVNSACRQQISPTSTLSSGYESACMESEIDEILYSAHHSTDIYCEEEPEYHELESDSYVSLDKECAAQEKLQSVRESMQRIIEDLESLGFETSIEDLQQAVKSSVTKRRRNLTHSTSSEHTCMTELSNNNVPSFQMFLKRQNQTTCQDSKHDEHITDIKSECKTQSYPDEPIYEEIGDYSDFDAVTHSECYRKPDIPPALPPRPSQKRRQTLPELHTSPKLVQMQRGSSQSLDLRKSKMQPCS